MKLKNIRLGRLFKISAQELGLDNYKIITCQRLYNNKVIDCETREYYQLEGDTEVESTNG